MSDVLAVLGSTALFVVAVVYVNGCEMLRRARPDRTVADQPKA